MPFSVLRLAHITWQDAEFQRRDHIEVSDIERNLARLLAIEDPNSGKEPSRLTSNQLKTLYLAAHHATDASAFAKTARAYHVPPSTLRRALQALEDRMFIRRDYVGNRQMQYFFEDPFFGEWVKRILKL